MKKLLLTLLVLIVAVSTAFATVFVTPKGKKYHVENCSTLSRSKVIHEVSIEQAKSMGYTACKVCKGRDNGRIASGVVTKTVAIAPSVKQAKVITGECVSVADGDTITVVANGTKYKVRFYGIDSPEKGQLFGLPAREEMTRLLLNKQVTIEIKDKDRYGRVVALVTVDGMSMQDHLVQNGLAWVYHKYCDISLCQTWTIMEHNARKNKTGLWKQPKPLAPWDWRAS